MSEVSVTSRAQHVLKVLVSRYIQDGQPVGSTTIAKDESINLSPASVRSVMADLEEQGLLVSPHTSAGRIPTSKGYRFFVDSLLKVKPLGVDQVKQFEQQLHPDISSEGLIQLASNLLSNITDLTGLVSVPKPQQQLLRHVEFLPLSGNRVLVILVLNEREVQNRIIYTDRNYSESELQQTANYLNANFNGENLENTREKLVAQMQSDREQMNDLMQAVIEVAQKAFETENQPDKKQYVLSGQGNLLKIADQSSLSKLQNLFSAFNEKSAILHLLDQCVSAEGVQIFIGSESGHEVLNHCSVIAAPYSVNGEVVGITGVIGPTRLAYDRVIPIVDVTSKILSAALNQGH